jgi:hypothetical protein
LIVVGVLSQAGIIQIVIGIVLVLAGGAGIYARRRELRPPPSPDRGGHKLER